MNAKTEIYTVDRPGRPAVPVKVTAVEIPDAPGPVYTVSRGPQVIGTLTLKESPTGRPRYYGHRNGDKAARVAQSRIEALRGILDRQEKADALERMAAAKPAQKPAQAPPAPQPADAAAQDAARAALNAARQEYADADALRQKAIARRRAAVAQALGNGLTLAECAALLGISRQMVEKISGRAS